MKPDELSALASGQIQPKPDNPRGRAALKPAFLACWQAHCPAHGDVVAYEQFCAGKPVYTCVLCMVEQARVCFATAEELTVFCGHTIDVARSIQPLPHV